jgi:F-type H+-transporting ATPase subunit alpha
MTVEKQVIQIYAATQKDEQGQGWIRAIPTADVARYMRELLEFLDGRHPEVARSIAEKKALDDGIRKSLDAALKEFGSVFQVEAA